MAAENFAESCSACFPEMFQKEKLLLVVVLLFFVLVMSRASAHIIGLSFEKMVDGKMIDIGASQEVIVARVPVSFDFDILDGYTKDEVPFSAVWVRIYQDKNNFYAGSIHKARLGPTTMLYQFAHPGIYTLSVRFQYENGSTTEATFDVAVDEVKPPPVWDWGAYGTYGGTALAGFAAGGFAAYMIGYTRKRTYAEKNASKNRII